MSPRRLVPIRPADHLPALVRLAADRDRAALGRVEVGATWIAGRLAAPGLDPEHDTALLTGSDGQVAGAVWLSRSSGRSAWDAELLLAPHATPDDAASLLDFAHRRCRTIAAGRPEGEVCLSCFVSERETALRIALSAYGFAAPRPYLRMSVPLGGATAGEPPVPGAVVRVPEGEAGLRAFHAVKNRAFSAEEAGMEPDGFEEWLRWTGADPGADPSQRALLELDGEPVGFANVTDRMAQTRGAAYLRQIGVLPRMRGRRLGAFLLRSVMAAARARGRGEMVLTVDTGNRAGLALYRATGWREESRFYDYAYRVTATPAPAGEVSSAR
ncbi:GNAT family N-acetyltransferase [Streptantibioticus cattleyicolor]|uniref:Putative N-acetyltransferase n=2 Tax=Streptantibioticus cattleyicolor TaxID=29303 RepID=F8JND4_STREN|nr:GNAT family N-acetyltransferase [Streptantibioticus cattleyicolor]AEW99103.1 putative N-acetyltransferase [Streptantibioticus cattleyicolor NRRL 8057 = DSM 46488]CAD18974.1 hypothetical N-acetyltransferase [Streptantibioticus cattleyicolor]CCB71851.1 N-acetyltransferase [Streptantibioticus cattleyicolor NRRL 8057 = DSM 46488]